MFQKSYGLIVKVKEKLHLEFPHCSMMVQYTVTAWLKRTFLNNYFASIFTEEDHSIIPTHDTQPLSSISHLTISVEGVAHLLENIDIKKTGGPDGIPARLLKELSFEIAPVLTLIYKASINQCTLPEDWLKASVVPIHKKGSRSQPSNYRPVSLTSICCKTLEHILYTWI